MLLFDHVDNDVIMLRILVIVFDIQWHLYLSSLWFTKVKDLR